ncbi:hypothetical protein L228DRAFT_283113 [Xylona heveae TC161]|uniref:BTB domain-containing protein n=1 Tax=Xylona heveae (strain CBS 132557 / TC161) TaxID=1328760 RepID=A0A165H6J9_XYLHT|nr:hypothetical protein L228DRAFT_283113 [Xylona heveae TC161]KZF23054.1 hypothetical protein L228DRAFT_283113 [Xylona heveae TC161]
MSRSQFPRYTDGDVIITLAEVHTYQLHSSVLRRCSAHFRRLLIEEKATKPDETARESGVYVRYQLELADYELDGVGWVVIKSTDSMNNGTSPTADSRPEAPRLALHRFTHYDNLFRTFYHIKPALDETNLILTIRDSMGLMELAERLGSISAITECIENALLDHGQPLFQSIAVNTMAWLDLAYRLQSATIMKESLIHVIGQWNSLTSETKSQMKPDVFGVCEKKYHELNEKKREIDSEILCHYTPECFAPGQSNISPNYRVLDSTKICGWMTVAIFRETYGRAINDGLNFRAEDGGAKLYRQIASCDDLVTQPAAKRFCEQFQLTEERDCIEIQLFKLKLRLKQLVQPLLVNRSLLDVKVQPLKYLTCVQIRTDDLKFLTERRNLESRG